MSIIQFFNNLFSNNRNNNNNLSININNYSIEHGDQSNYTDQLDNIQIGVNDKDYHLLTSEKNKLYKIKNKFDNYSTLDFLSNKHEIFKLENSYYLHLSQVNEDLYYDPNDIFLKEFKIFLNEKKKCIDILKDKLNELEFHCDINKYQSENSLDHNLNHNIECPICLDSIDDSKKKVIILNCNHVYHRDCLFDWYSKKKIENLCIYNCDLNNNLNNNYLLES